MTVLRVGLLCVGAWVAGCTAARDRGAANWVDQAQVVKAPEVGRCAKFKAGSAPASACNEAKYLGEIYVRKLAPGDEVCLEGGFGDEPTGGCQARAAVVDNATGRALLEIRSAKPDSKWFNKEQVQYWFEEGAMLELYLADHGY